MDDEKADAASTVAVAFVKAVFAELTRLVPEVCEDGYSAGE